MKLSPLIRQFFDQYLPHIRGFSPETVRAYRDAFRLFLPFAASFYKIKVKSLWIEHISRKLITVFLEDLQNERNNLSKIDDLLQCENEGDLMACLDSL